MRCGGPESAWSAAFLAAPANGNVLGHNGLPGLGWNEVRLAVAGDILVAGTGNVLIGMDRRLNSLATRWQIWLPSSGPTVSITVIGRWIYATINGYLYAVDPETGKINTTAGDEVAGEFLLCTNGANLYCGGAAIVSGHSLPGLGDFFTQLLSSVPVTPMNLLADGASLFATANGHVHQLNAMTRTIQYSNNLTGMGLNEW